MITMQKFAFFDPQSITLADARYDDVIFCKEVTSSLLAKVISQGSGKGGLKEDGRVKYVLLILQFLQLSLKV